MMSTLLIYAIKLVIFVKRQVAQATCVFTFKTRMTTTLSHNATELIYAVRSFFVQHVPGAIFITLHFLRNLQIG